MEPGRRLGMTFLVLLVGAAGVGVGITVGQRNSTPSACPAVKQEFLKSGSLLKEAQALPPSDSRRGVLILVVVERRAVLVEQNPSCFDATTRAEVEAMYRHWKREAARRP